MSSSTASQAILNCWYGVDSFTHPYFGPAFATALNRWLEEEWLAKDERLRAYASVTPQHIPAAVAEIERIAGDRRFVGVLVPARAPATYGSQRYWPIWEAAAEHGLAVGITFGGGGGSPPTPVGWLGSYWEEYAVATLPFHGHVASFALSGLFEPPSRPPGRRARERLDVAPGHALAPRPGVVRHAPRGALDGRPAVRVRRAGGALHDPARRPAPRREAATAGDRAHGHDRLAHGRKRLPAPVPATATRRSSPSSPRRRPTASASKTPQSATDSMPEVC